MNLYASYLIIFGIESILNVAMLSFMENVVIHRTTLMKWVNGLPITLSVALVLFIIIAIIVRVIIKPLMDVVKRAKIGQITEEEKYIFIPAFKKVKIATYLLIFAGFVIGNSIVVIIKAKLGIQSLGSTPLDYKTTFVLILGLCINYALLQSFYCTDGWEVFAQPVIHSLEIYDTKNYKTSKFTKKLGFIVSGCQFNVGWHLLCCGFGIARFPGKNFGITDFLPLAVFVLLWTAASETFIFLITLKNLRLRFMRTSDVVTNLRKNGDLATRLSIDSFDDFGYLSGQLNKFMDYLKETISQIKTENFAVNDNALTLASEVKENISGVNTVISSFSDISEKNRERDSLLKDTQQNIINLGNEAEEISKLVSSQAAAVEQNASSITEMVANINSMTEMIKKARSVSQELSVVSEKGNHEVEKTLSLIEEISEKSERMSEITQVISSVAEQTNLLAMNAAIEAAHAGDAGKGFSVVADEIHKLAENTSSSTKEITDLINDMIDVVSKSTQSMTETSAVFSQISGGVKNSTQVVDTIANAMEEQSTGASETLSVTNEIASQINEINSLVKKQADYNGEISQHIENVVNLSAAVNSAHEESGNFIKEFASSMNLISDAAQKNQDSVNVVTKKLDYFKLD